MNVKELIEILNKLPDYSEVVVNQTSISRICNVIFKDSIEDVDEEIYLNVVVIEALEL